MMPRGGKGTNPVTRFWAKVRPEVGDACWLWTGAAQRYGTFKPDGKNVLAHRYSWELHFGPIPEGLCVCHKCDVPLCVRPDHLFIGTMKDNCQDREQKGRGNQPRGEKQHSAKLTEEIVRDIKKRIADGESMYAMGKQYGLHRSAIRCIKTGRSWAWVT